MPAYAVKELEVYKKQAKTFYTTNGREDIIISRVGKDKNTDFDKAKVEWITENVITISFTKDGVEKARIYITTTYEEILF